MEKDTLRLKLSRLVFWFVIGRRKPKSLSIFSFMWWPACIPSSSPLHAATSHPLSPFWAYLSPCGRQPEGGWTLSLPLLSEHSALPPTHSTKPEEWNESRWRRSQMDVWPPQVLEPDRSGLQFQRSLTTAWPPAAHVNYLSLSFFICLET